METRIEIAREILNEFLERWDLESVKKMKLEEYVSVGNPDTFCQWIETRTKSLGGINGITSIKFGIFKRADSKKKLKTCVNDNQYSWQYYYGSDIGGKFEAYKQVRKEVVETIEYALVGNFEAIDNLHLTSLFKWKIAYLYSNERLIPIFKKEVLAKIAKAFGLNVDRKTTISAIQKLMISKKPPHLNIYEYSNFLYQTYSDQNKSSGKRKLRKRRSSERKNNIEQIVTTKGITYIKRAIHNTLQNQLKEKLINLYGKHAVILEQNFVDIKLELKNSITFYEVKSAPYASDCIREGLGQIMSYAYFDEGQKNKKIVIVGQYPANDEEKKYIDFIKKNLKVDFDYEHL